MYRRLLILLLGLAIQFADPLLLFAQGDPESQIPDTLELDIDHGQFAGVGSATPPRLQLVVTLPAQEDL